jgi:hypothetical protein
LTGWKLSVFPIFLAVELASKLRRLIDARRQKERAAADIGSANGKPPGKDPGSGGPEQQKMPRKEKNEHRKCKKAAYNRRQQTRRIFPVEYLMSFRVSHEIREEFYSDVVLLRGGLIELCARCFLFLCSGTVLLYLCSVEKSNNHPNYLGCKEIGNKVDSGPGPGLIYLRIQSQLSGFEQNPRECSHFSDEAHLQPAHQ